MSKNHNTHDKPVMAASIGAAAGMLECHLSALQQAKKDGCPAFRSNGSVNITELRAWLEERPAQPVVNKAQLECRRLLAQCEKIEHGNEVERGLYTHNDAIKADMLRIGSATRAALQTLKADAPTWEGLAAAEIERRVSERIDSICADLHDATSDLYR